MCIGALSADISHLSVDISHLSVDIRRLSVDIRHLSVDIRHLSVDITPPSIDRTLRKTVLPAFVSTTPTPPIRYPPEKAAKLIRPSSVSRYMTPDITTVTTTQMSAASRHMEENTTL